LDERKVTRVDIAVDIVGLHLAALLLSNKTGGKQHWYLSPEGKPETGYLGIKPKDKNAKWKIYNKRQDIKDKSKFPIEQAFGGLSRTRLEYTNHWIVSWLSKLLSGGAWGVNSGAYRASEADSISAMS
jgi:hypothetical protein